MLSSQPHCSSKCRPRDPIVPPHRLPATGPLSTTVLAGVPSGRLERMWWCAPSAPATQGGMGAEGVAIVEGVVCCEPTSRRGSWLSGRWPGGCSCWLFFSCFAFFHSSTGFCSWTQTPTIFTAHVVAPVILSSTPSNSNGLRPISSHNNYPPLGDRGVCWDSIHHRHHKFAFSYNGTRRLFFVYSYSHATDIDHGGVHFNPVFLSAVRAKRLVAGSPLPSTQARPNEE